MKRLLLIAVLALLFFTSCKKTCRCYRYDGNVDEFSVEELDEQNTSCVDMEEINRHLTYSLCEKVLF
ncbi:MAG: hypothetical protein J6Y98_08860 [Bacteroidales bacterium]|nr:hypothetical protein [Bacteroidales bacterium]MCR5193792.1 hypothetical protein [Bacteroidales bacterium]